MAKRGAGVQDISPGPEKAAERSATLPEAPRATDSPPESSSAETLPLTASDGVADSAPPPVSRSTSAVAPSSTPVSAPVPSPPPTSGYRVPFGYVPGAISVELPKRQRTHKHHAGTAAMPRSYSSLT